MSSQLGMFKSNSLQIEIDKDSLIKNPTPPHCNELKKKRLSSPGVLTERVLPWFEFFFIQ